LPDLAGSLRPLEQLTQPVDLLGRWLWIAEEQASQPLALVFDQTGGFFGVLHVALSSLQKLDGACHHHLPSWACFAGVGKWNLQT
jgi:hypothetical protein